MHKFLPIHLGCFLLFACSEMHFEDPLDVAPADAVVGSPKRAFITSGIYNGGAIGGLLGADAICLAHATGAGLGGTWKAWLSDSTTDAITRINDVSPWVGMDGNVVVASIADLTSNSVSIDLTEGGFPSFDAVWTGTDNNGTKNANGFSFCGDWLVIAGSAVAGASKANLGSTSWTNEFGFGCGTDNALYCFEQ